MAVKMRLTRMGDKKSPFYRAEVVIDADKAKDWLAKGVQPTETVRALLLNAGIIEKSAKLSPAKTNPKKKKD